MKGTSAILRSLGSLVAADSELTSLLAASLRLVSFVPFIEPVLSRTSAISALPMVRTTSLVRLIGTLSTPTMRASVMSTLPETFAVILPEVVSWTTELRCQCD